VNNSTTGGKVEDDSTTNDSDDANQTALVGPVTEFNDTVAAPGTSGEYSACFRSEEDNSNNAPAAGTSGAPFLVL
jgi:hypothetical protein